MPIATDKRTGTGMVQLSYSATRNRYANSTAKPRIIAVLPSARFSWNAVSVHSPAYPCGNVLAATSSIAFSA